ncbi:MAG TPA: hypothetical protein VMW76_08655 [Bacteroidales bacterium]|nr:hypothetical protein [Bacteroidales bacterium]
MKRNITSAKLEKETFRLFYKDGIFDLSFGSMLIIYTINMYIDINAIGSSLIMNLLILPVIIIFALVKGFVTTKRIGYVKFIRGRNIKMLKTFIIATIALLFTTLMFVLAASGKISGDTKNSPLPLLIEFMFLVGVFSILAYYTDYTNFYIVGLAMAIGSPLSIYLEPLLGTRYYGLAVIFIAGCYLFINGVVQFATFFNKFPRANYDEKGIRI